MRKETVERKKLKEKKKKQVEDISKDMQLDKKLSKAEKNKLILSKMYNNSEEEVQEDTIVESKSRTRRISFKCKCGCEVNIESDNPKHFTKTTCYSCE